jgi:hypothetical protein
MKAFLRLLRGWFYRRYPVVSRGRYRKKLAGYERRWGLEKEGFTKEGFFRIFQRRVLFRCRPGVFYELVTGDGLVGSLGVWLERLGQGWTAAAWEHRTMPLVSLKKNRQQTKIYEGRLTIWSEKERGIALAGITTRGAREAAGVCREIRAGRIRPNFVGIWNPTRRPVWIHRLGRAGYQLEIVYERMEFYVDAERESGVRGRGRSSKGGKVNE